jgi:hypothetical protein
MTMSDRASLADISALLEAAGYHVEGRHLADYPAVLAESPYALVACVELDGWTDLEDKVFDVQGALTRIAQQAPSPRSWDLYVVALLESLPPNSEHRALVEGVEADTRYARKFVRAGLHQDGLERALRPLLPLRPPADLAIRDPLEELRAELRTLAIDDALATVAVASFAKTDTVEIP